MSLRTARCWSKRSSANYGYDILSCRALLTVAASLAGRASASFSGWLLHVSGSYRAPMPEIFISLLIGAGPTAILLQRELARKLVESASEAAPVGQAIGLAKR